MTAIPLNDLQPRLSPQVTDLFATLPVGAQVLENTTLGAILGMIPRAPLFFFDGGGSPLAAPLVRALYAPFALTITSASLLADQSGSCVVDIGVVARTAYTGAFAGSITASDKPTLSSAVEYLDTALTGWTLAVPADSAIIFKLVSSSTITWLTATLGARG